MAYKNQNKTVKKKQDLPSFLLQPPEVPENTSYSKKDDKKKNQLGPIFFGCNEYQPMFHRLNLGLSFDVHKTASSTENLLRHAFISEAPPKIWFEEKEAFVPCRKRQVLFTDPYLHRCPGQKRVFVPGPKQDINLGETISTIEGEASQEIPLYCVRESLDGALESDYQVIYLSDVWEKRRVYMRPKERMAHAHFAKEFVTLQVIGPTIPSSITITKLPSKRKTDSQLDLELKPKTKLKKEVKGGDVKTKKETEDAAKKTEDESTEKPIIEIEVKSEDEAKEASIDQEVHDESSMVDEDADVKDEETDVKNEEEVKDGEDEVNEAEDEVPTE